MEFTSIILEKLNFIFKKYNLSVVEQRSNYLKLQSAYVIVIIAHNQFENSNILWLGKNNEKSDKIEINNEILLLFFKSQLKLSLLPVDIFINNLKLFFENEAKSLLMGDKSELSDLERFDIIRSKKYTENLIFQQELNKVDKAWADKNYKEFIKLLDNINIYKLPLSYELKYKIAIKNN